MTIAKVSWSNYISVLTQHTCDSNIDVEVRCLSACVNFFFSSLSKIIIKSQVVSTLIKRVKEHGRKSALFQNIESDK